MPTNLQPFLYELQIQPYIGRNYDRPFTFDGSVNISFTCANATKKLVLHAKDIKIISVRLNQVVSTSYLRGSVYNSVALSDQFVYDDEREFVTITMLDACVKSNVYIATIVYSGLIPDSLAGFYRSSYIDVDGSEQL